MSWKDDVWNVNSNQQPRKLYLTKKEITKMKPNLRQDFPDDSTALFNSAWSDILANIRAGNEVLDYEHLKAMYDNSVSYKVNNPKSKFYIYG